MKKIDWILVGFIVGAILFLAFLGSKLDLTTSTERGYEFCRNNGMQLRDYSMIGGELYGECVFIEGDEIVQSRDITYVKGIKEWKFVEACIRTQKGYCASECYENNKLIPCEEFSSDEHFCNEGVCRVSGICPDYYDRLKGKTITECLLVRGKGTT